MWGIAVIHINGNYIKRKANEYDEIYNLLEPVLGHEEAEDAASWCELASIGETWESFDGTSVEIELVSPEDVC